MFSEYPGTKVYLRFDVILSVQGTSQIFAETVPVAPTPPELKIVGPGMKKNKSFATDVQWYDKM